MLGVTGSTLADISRMNAVLVALPAAATNFTDLVPEWACALSTATVDPLLAWTDQGAPGASPAVSASKSSQNRAPAQLLPPLPPLPRVQDDPELAHATAVRQVAAIRAARAIWFMAPRLTRRVSSTSVGGPRQSLNARGTRHAGRAARVDLRLASRGGGVAVRPALHPAAALSRTARVSAHPAWHRDAARRDACAGRPFRPTLLDPPRRSPCHGRL